MEVGRPLKTLELRLHLAGSVSPARLRTLAERHGCPQVPRLCLEDADRYCVPGESAGLRDGLRAVASVLRTPADHREAALDLAAALAGQDVVYAEVAVDYGGLRRRGADPRPVQSALAEAAEEAEASHGVSLRWLPSVDRGAGPDAAWRVLEAACRAGAERGVVGFGLDGEDAAGPAADFAPHVRDARAEGLGVTFFANDVASVRDALALSVDRIGPGTGAASDPQLLAMLALSGTFVEFCPGGDVAVGVAARLADHPLRVFLEAGVRGCLNTGDPALLGLELREEYAAAAARCGLTPREADAMRWQALAAAFMSEAMRKEIGARLATDADSRNDP